MFSYDFPRPSVTATVVMFYDDQVLIGKRSLSSTAYPGAYCFPGGFLNAKTDNYPGETIEETAVREVKEETNIDISINDLHFCSVRSDPNTDPRAHVVNICYYVHLNKNQFNQLQSGDDLEETKFVPTTSILTMQLAFDHNKILIEALSRKIDEAYLSLS